MTVSLRKLKALSSSSDPGALQCCLVLWRFNRPTYDEWVGLVERAIAFEVAQMAQRRNDLQELGEDALTALLVIALNSLGLRASSAVVNGNCDVVVEYADDYQWLGEAKLFTGVTVIWKGYLQLTTRYAAGLPNQSKGGMLLYCFKESAATLLSEWREVLNTSVPHANIQDGELPLTFRSEDICASSGLALGLLHFAFVLFHSPQENKIKLSKDAMKAGTKAKAGARIIGSRSEPAARNKG